MAWPSTPTHGKLARVIKNATQVDYSSDWSISVTQDAAVFSRQGQQYKEAVPGQSGFTGSANFLFAQGNAEQAALTALIIPTTLTTALTTDVKFCGDTTANVLTGPIVVTGYNLTAGVGDIIKVSFTFQGSGAITISA